MEILQIQERGATNQDKGEIQIFQYLYYRV